MKDISNIKKELVDKYRFEVSKLSLPSEAYAILDKLHTSSLDKLQAAIVEDIIENIKVPVSTDAEAKHQYISYDSTERVKQWLRDQYRTEAIKKIKEWNVLTVVMNL